MHRALLAFVIVVLGPLAVAYGLGLAEDALAPEVARTWYLPEMAGGMAITWNILVYPHRLAWSEEGPLLTGLWAPVLALCQWSAVAVVVVVYAAKQRFWQQLAISVAAVVFVGVAFLLLSLAVGMRFPYP